MKKIVYWEREKKMMPPDLRGIQTEMAEMERRGRRQNLKRDFNPPLPVFYGVIFMIIMLLIIAVIVFAFLHV